MNHNNLPDDVTLDMIDPPIHRTCVDCGATHSRVWFDVQYVGWLCECCFEERKEGENSE